MVEIKVTLGSFDGYNEIAIDFIDTMYRLSTKYEDRKWETKMLELNMGGVWSPVGKVIESSHPIWDETKSGKIADIKNLFVKAGFCDASAAKDKSAFLEYVLESITEDVRAESIVVTGGDDGLWFMLDKKSVDKEAVANRIVENYEANGSRFKTMDDTYEIYCYCDGIYKLKGKNRINVEVQEMCGTHSSVFVQTEVRNFITHRTLTNRNKFNDINSTELNMENGIYNYMTGEFTEHSRDKLYTSQFPVTYDPDATCPCIDKYLDKTLDDKNKRLLLEGFAYCFVPSYRMKSSLWLIGPTNSAKSIALDIIRAMLGNENVTSMSLQEMTENRHYDRVRLYGKKANICADMSKGLIRDTDFFKKATGGGRDVFTVRNIHKEPFDMVNYAKFLFAMNEMPDIDENDEAIAKRIEFVTFTKKISDEDEDIDFVDKVLNPKELSGFFNRLMPILLEVLEQGKFSSTFTMDEKRAKLDEEKDPLASFMSQCTIASSESILKSVLYLEYVDWCKHRNLTPMKLNVMGRIFKSKKDKYNLKDGKPSFGVLGQLPVWFNLELVSNDTAQSHEIKQDGIKKDEPKQALIVPVIKGIKTNQ